MVNCMANYKRAEPFIVVYLHIYLFIWNGLNHPCMNNSSSFHFFFPFFKPFHLILNRQFLHYQAKGIQRHKNLCSQTKRHSINETLCHQHHSL